MARLHADEGGQISALGVLAAAAFACVLMLVINTGAATSSKIQLQNAADASTMSGANWVARGLNVISMDNVTESQLLAVILILPALDRAGDSAKIVLTGEQVVACALSWTGVGAALCLFISDVQQPYLDVFRELVSSIRATGIDQQNSSGALWNAMLALSAVSHAVTVSFPAVAEAESIRIARENGAQGGLLIPAGLSFSLPVHAGTMSPDLCDPTHYGSRGPGNREYSPFLGYPQGQGPLEVQADKIKPVFYLIYNSLITQFFDGYREAEYRKLCGSTGGPLVINEPVKSYQDCKARGGTGQWYLIYYRSKPLPNEDPNFAVSSESDPRLDGKPDGTQQQRDCSWMPPGKLIGNDKYRLVEDSPVVMGQDANGQNIYYYQHSVYEYSFLGGSVSHTEGEDAGGGGEVPGPSDQPIPYMLGPSGNPTADGARRNLHYLAVLYRSSTVPAAPKYFIPALGEHRLAYAQSRVYNPTAYDLFTQDWRVALEPAAMVEDGSLMGGLGNSSLPRFASDAGGFNSAAGLFSPSNFIRLFNNH